MEIGRNESNAIKGLLIFLIVLGHNAFITNYFDGLYHYLYSFHVACFFILSFLYPSKKISKQRVVDYFIRNYTPYVFFFMIFLCTKLIFEYFGFDEPNLTYTPYQNNLIDFLLTLFNGGIFSLPSFIGFQYLWFLPVMFSFSVIKDFFYSISVSYKRVLILFVGLLCFFFLYVFMYSAPYPKVINLNLEHYSPFSVFQALGFLFLSWITFYFIDNCRCKYVFVILFITLTALYWTIDIIYIKWLLRCFMPTTVFVLLFSIKGILGQSDILENIGKISLQIYIVQTPVATICYKILPLLFNCNNVLFILFSQVLIFTISYFIALLFVNVSMINRLIFPRTLDSWIGYIRNIISKYLSMF